MLSVGTMPSQEIDMAREVVITAAREGNEQATEAALDIFEERVREQAVEAAAAWLERGAPVAAKWLRHDYQPSPTT